MKTYVVWMLCTALLLTGCGQSAKKNAPQGVRTRAQVVAQESLQAYESGSLTPDPNVDVDLTVMSSTMVFAEVYNIMNQPESYLGKKIKLSGTYNTQYFEEQDKTYHFILIADATACCQQGIEFLWSGSPQPYPALGTPVEAIGVFEVYHENQLPFYHVVIDQLILTETQ